jgi:hypothetical protein
LAYDEMDWSGAMDLIGNVEWTSTACGYRQLLLPGGLQVPDDVGILRVSLQLGGCQRARRHDVQGGRRIKIEVNERM